MILLTILIILAIDVPLAILFLWAFDKFVDWYTHR